MGLAGSQAAEQKPKQSPCPVLKSVPVRPSHRLGPPLISPTAPCVSPVVGTPGRKRVASLTALPPWTVSESADLGPGAGVRHRSHPAAYGCRGERRPRGQLGTPSEGDLPGPYLHACCPRRIRGCLPLAAIPKLPRSCSERCFSCGREWLIVPWTLDRPCRVRGRYGGAQHETNSLAPHSESDAAMLLYAA